MIKNQACNDHEQSTAANEILEMHYQTTRGEYTEKVTTQERNLEKYLLTLSAGALSLTVTAYKGGTYSDLGFILLTGSWLFFGMSLLLALISLQASIQVHRKAIKILDEQRKMGYDYEKVMALLNDIKLSQWIGRLNGACAVIFVFGVIALAFFSIGNLNREEKSMSENKSINAGKPEISNHPPAIEQKGNTLLTPTVIPQTPDSQAGTVVTEGNTLVSPSVIAPNPTIQSQNTANSSGSGAGKGK